MLYALGPPRLIPIIVREYLLMLALFTTAASAAETRVYACPPAWPRDRECFRQQTIYFKTGNSLVPKEAKRQITEVATFLLRLVQ
jgi:hypothetical protein